MSSLDSIRHQRELKDRLLEYLSFLHPRNPRYHGFAVLICRYAGNPETYRTRYDDHEVKVVRAVGFTDAEKSTFKVLYQSRKESSTRDALGDVLSRIEREFGRMTGGMKEGDVYDGVKESAEEAVVEKGEGSDDVKME